MFRTCSILLLFITQSLHTIIITFQDLKGVVLDAMRGAFGSKFTTEVEVAWDKAIDVLFSKIFEGEDMI